MERSNVPVLLMCEDDGFSGHHPVPAFSAGLLALALQRKAAIDNKGLAGDHGCAGVQEQNGFSDVIRHAKAFEYGLVTGRLFSLFRTIRSSYWRAKAMLR